MSRIIDIGRFEDGPLRFDEPVVPTPFDQPPGDPLEVVEARIRGEARRGPRGVDLAGHLSATVRLSCSRCLAPLTRPIEADFFLILVKAEPAATGGEAETDPDDVSLYPAPAGVVSLDDIAAEQVALNLPLKVLCGAGCRGLCPTCGGNRNDLECGCADEVIDPRLAPLLELKKRSRES